MDFGSVTDIFVGSQQGHWSVTGAPAGTSTAYFCIRNTAPKASTSIGGVGAYTVSSGLPAGSTLTLSYNNGAAQSDLAGFAPFSLAPGQDTVQYATTHGGSNGYLHADLAFDGTQTGGTYSFTVTINGS